MVSVAEYYLSHLEWEIWKDCLIVDEWLFNEIHAGICDSGIIIKSCGNEMGGKKNCFANKHSLSLLLFNDYNGINTLHLVVDMFDC